MLRQSRPQHGHFLVSLSNLSSESTVWQGVSTDRMCACARPHVCPSDRLRVLQKDTTSRGARWPRQAIRVKLPLFVSKTQPRSSRRSFRCSGGIFVLFIALVVASLSMPAVDSMPLMSPPAVTRFSPFSKTQSCLISCSHQLSGPSGSPK